MIEYCLTACCGAANSDVYMHMVRFRWNAADRRKIRPQPARASPAAVWQWAADAFSALEIEKDRHMNYEQFFASNEYSTSDKWFHGYKSDTFVWRLHPCRKIADKDLPVWLDLLLLLAISAHGKIDHLNEKIAILGYIFATSNEWKISL